MPPSVRKLAPDRPRDMLAEVVDAAFAYLTLGITAGSSNDPPAIRASWVATDLVGWYVIAPWPSLFCCLGSSCH